MTAESITVLPEQSGATLAAVLRARWPEQSWSQVRRVIEGRRVRVGGDLCLDPARRLKAGDAAGFWSLVRENGDDLRWCGASPLYVFLRAVAPAGGELLRYEQWNIDEQSVVSFAGMSFRR